MGRKAPPKHPNTHFVWEKPQNPKKICLRLKGFVILKNLFFQMIVHISELPRNHWIFIVFFIKCCQLKFHFVNSFNSPYVLLFLFFSFWGGVGSLSKCSFLLLNFLLLLAALAVWWKLTVWNYLTVLMFSKFLFSSKKPCRNQFIIEHVSSPPPNLSSLVGVWKEWLSN